MTIEKIRYIEKHFWDHMHAAGDLSDERYLLVKDGVWTLGKIWAQLLKWKNEDDL